VNQRARVAVIGYEVATKLFSTNESPLGESIRIGGISFEVIGVLPESGEGGFGNPDNTALIPLTTAQTRLGHADAFRGSLKVSSIYIEVDQQSNMDAAAQVTAVLRERHRLGDEYKNDFKISNQAQLLEFSNTKNTTLTAFLGSIAGVSLLVSVTERTREIGIRKAVGAKRRDIMLQFLAEAMVLSLIGGFMGIAVGYGISQALPPVFTATPQPAKFQAEVITVGINVRQGPGTAYSTSGTVAKGEVLTVTGVSADGNWLQIITAGSKTGWISGQSAYVRISGS